MPVEGRCVHFNGMQHKACEAGVEYDSARIEHSPVPPGGATVSFPCLPSMNSGGASCPHYRPRTPEEIAAEKAALARTMDLLGRGLSSCCETAIDERHVIRWGPHKGHGPRYCSKCGKVAFMV